MAGNKALAQTQDKTSSAPVVVNQPESPEKANGPQRVARIAEGSAPPSPPNGAPSPTRTAEILASRSNGPGAAPRAQMMRSLQRSVGNARVSNLIDRQIQTKLSVGAADDPQEREADRVAESVTQPGTKSEQTVARQIVMKYSLARLANVQSETKKGQGEEPAPAPAAQGALPSTVEKQPPNSGPIQRKCDCPGEASGGECVKCSSDANPIQREASSDAKHEDVDAKMEDRITSPSGGQPLPEGVQREMEAGMGTDFSNVRVHDSATDRADAESLNAKAFTHGSDIWLGAGESAHDRKLMAHELTHVVQQQSAAPPERNGESTVAAARAGPHAQVGRMVQRSVGPGAYVQRNIFEYVMAGDMTNRQLIDKAIATEDSVWVHLIRDYGEAGKTERMQLVDIMLDLFWVDNDDELVLEAIWGSFGSEVLEVAAENYDRWKQCFDRGADLDDLEAIDNIKEAFRWDTRNAALNFLEINELYINSELQALGLGLEGPFSPEEAKEKIDRLQEIQDVAQEVIDAREALHQLRQIPVGWNRESIEDYSFYAVAGFDPEHQPEFDHHGVERNPWAGYEDIPQAKVVPQNVRSEIPAVSWDSVREQFIKITAVITGYSNKYPIMYGLLADESNADKLLAQVAADGPQAALSVIQQTMNGVLGKIAEARVMIYSEDLDDRDFKPVHHQLFDGLRPPGWSGFPWEQSIYKWAAEDLLDDWTSRQFWIQLGLSVLAAAAFVVAELATFGGATFFLAAGVGVGASIFGAARSWEHYDDLATSADATISDELAIVSRGQAEAALVSAIVDSVFAFLDVLGPAIKAAKAFRGTGKAIEEGAAEALEQGAREASQQVLERGAVEAAEETAETASRVAPEQARNWAEVSPLIGQHVDMVTLPAGYTTYRRGGRTFIRRANANNLEFAKIAVDANGFIITGRSVSRRVSRPGALARNLGQRPSRHQAHHVVPDEIVRDHPLFEAARRRGQPPYNVDDAANGVYLPEADEFRLAGISDDLPLHSGSHPRYNDLARGEAQSALDELLTVHGTLDAVPDDILSRAAHDVQEEMWAILQGWMETQGGKLR